MEEFHSYRIKPIERLGQGAFGYVEKVELYNSQNKVCGTYARKVLSPSHEILACVSLDEIKRRFIREVIYQSKCLHSNIIQVFLFNKYTENPYFIMEIGQSDLATKLREGDVNEESKISIIKMMLAATKKIHDKEYLHRDIKPQNVLSFPNGVYKLSDFGLVKNIDSSSETTAITAIGVGMGTRRYMAPEIIIDAEYSKQTDIYALGILFSDLNVESLRLQKIIDKCKKRDKDSRYITVDDIITDVNAALHVKTECTESIK